MATGGRIGLIDDALVGFDVGVAGALLAALRPARIEHEFGEIEIAAVAADAAQLDESHLYPLVAGPDFAGAGAEGSDEQVGAAQGDIEEGAVAGGLVVGHGGFVEMAEIVKFVAADALENPALGAGPRMGV